MADQARADRMAKRILTIVASALEQDVKDPRVELITITDVKVTGDLHDATVYYTVRGRTIDDEPDVEQAREALKKARGQLRKIVGDELGVRYTPTLTFKYDSVPETSAHMEELLEKARQQDVDVRAQAEKATPAGEENPYKDSE